MKKVFFMHKLALDYMQKLLAIPSPTGFTDKAADYLMETLQGMGFQPWKQRKGGVYCELGGEGRGILLSAHVDTLGAMVRSIKGNGRIRYTHIGGWADSTVETENCLVHTRDGKSYSGTVQSTKASQHVFGDMNGDTRGETTLEIVLDEVVKTREDVEKLGVKDQLSLKCGIFGAEPWTESMRQEIEQKLGIKAYDIYGLSEVLGPGVSYECEAQAGMHICEDNFIAEIIDPDTGEVLPEGSSGELVFTSLTKEGFPVIRYRTRDICSLNPEPCACGRTHIRMNKPQGRSDDMLIIRGVNVFPSQIEEVLLKVSGGQLTPNYQIVVDRVNNNDTFDVNVEMSEQFFSDDVKSIEKLERSITGELRSMLGISAKVHLVNPNSIARSEGKAKRVIDNRKLR